MLWLQRQQTARLGFDAWTRQKLTYVVDAIAPVLSFNIATPSVVLDVEGHRRRGWHGHPAPDLALHATLQSGKPQSCCKRSATAFKV